MDPLSFLIIQQVLKKFWVFESYASPRGSVAFIFSRNLQLLSLENAWYIPYPYFLRAEIYPPLSLSPPPWLLPIVLLLDIIL